MTIGYVLSGGASHGAVQIGMTRALLERGLRPQVIVGASVGAMNGAWLSGHGDSNDLEIDGLDDIWRSLSRGDVFPLEFVGGLLGFVGKRRSLLSDHGIRTLLDRALNFDRMEHAPIPFAAVATDVLTGELVVLDEGAAEPAIRASASIPGVFPPVRHAGRWLMDGGVASNTPITTAAAMGATQIFVLPAETVGEQALPSNAIGMAVNAVGLLVDARMRFEIEQIPDGVEVIQLAPSETSAVSPVDFSKTAELIEAGYQGASTKLREYLETDGTFP